MLLSFPSRDFFQFSRDMPHTNTEPCQESPFIPHRKNLHCLSLQVPVQLHTMVARISHHNIPFLSQGKTLRNRKIVSNWSKSRQVNSDLRSIQFTPTSVHIGEKRAILVKNLKTHNKDVCISHFLLNQPESLSFPSQLLEYCPENPRQPQWGR